MNSNSLVGCAKCGSTSSNIQWNGDEEGDRISIGAGFRFAFPKSPSETKTGGGDHSAVVAWTTGWRAGALEVLQSIADLSKGWRHGLRGHLSAIRLVLGGVYTTIWVYQII